MARPARRTRISKARDMVIRETPGGCGGYPCVGNTRIPVRLIVETYSRTGNVETTAVVYDMLSREQIQFALDYYRSNPARVDEDIETNAQAWEELTGQTWPA